MSRKIPPDAFDFYVSQGIARSYQAVADKYGVSKVAVTNLAMRDGWQKKLSELEARARQASDEKLVESMEMVNQRHLKLARFVQAKAYEALKNMSLDTAMEAVRALDLALRQERLLMGEPTDRTSSVEEIIKREYAAWMKPAGEPESWDDPPPPADAA